MNLAEEMHRLTGRMRKARRRADRHDRIALVWGVLAMVPCFVAGDHELALSVRLVSLAIGALLFSRYHRRAHRGRLYQRVVDRCQGAMLTILALQGPALPKEQPSGDRMRWS